MIFKIVIFISLMIILLACSSVFIIYMYGFDKFKTKFKSNPKIEQHEMLIESEKIFRDLESNKYSTQLCKYSTSNGLTNFVDIIGWYCDIHNAARKNKNIALEYIDLFTIVLPGTLEAFRLVKNCVHQETKKQAENILYSYIDEIYEYEKQFKEEQRLSEKANVEFEKSLADIRHIKIRKKN